ncbi:phosphate ABC transporter permease PstA [Pseudonocardia abyssalis]|uniref:Phosphate transport system permease protein PstA n=1 Tax=Pseudonocardia abyssalis TaxID=2792008 RepID=A0ABS6UX86_9PSEU|nr:phosphate ABC transporter permease PstA [Pseudonocardia abyssalis]MBW0117355.1 phosphate ABC transporter permease PstA [Pseudonocardia abyssalis]MBW0136870.1 phosphate ABC transporter permease PstA [Pseudonocardia abyssalis]
MTIDTEKRDPVVVEPAVLEVQGQLPRFAVPGGVVAAAVVVGVLLALTGFNTALWVVGTAVLFAVGLYAASRAVEGRRKATDRLVTVVVTAAFLLALLPLISVLWTVISNGLTRFDAEFFTSSMRGVVGEGGGVYHAILGTLIITALAAVISIPIGLLTAVYLVEYGKNSRLARSITFFVDVMTGIPSIVAGLFAVALFTLVLGPGARLGFAGSVALSVLMIPIVVRATEEMLKIVPNELREAAFALGVPKWRTILKVVIPTSVAGIASGVTLAIARVIGETAPLLVAVGVTTGVNLNPFDGRMATLPVFSYFSYATPGVPREPYLDRAWAAALVLIIIVMVLNLLARLIARAFAPKTR